MNIFFLDKDPTLNAQYHCDKHVVKMPLETAQILSSVHHILGVGKDNPFLYKLTHEKHPSVQWAAMSEYNYNILLEIGRALCAEYSHRYNKVHGCEDLLYSALNVNPFTLLDNPYCREETELPLCMPEYIKDYYNRSHPYEIDNLVINAYRAYYILEKNHLHSWKHRLPPLWISVHSDRFARELRDLHYIKLETMGA